MRFFNKNRKKRFSGLNESIAQRVRLITAVDPKNVVSEQFRTLRTSIDFSSATKEGMKTLMISSSLPSEGKSTISANLAVVYAQQNKKVLLVDADLRRPTLEMTFKLTNNFGLTNYLVNYKNDVDHIITNVLNNLDVIASGPIPPNPAELLGSQRMAELIITLKKKYDIIIFDVPPFLAVTDAQVLVQKMDGVAIVVDSGKTSKVALQRTREMLNISKAQVIGFIYNDRSYQKKSGYGYEYGYK